METQIYKMSDRALRTELERCLTCREKPCMQACPAGVCPTEFIAAARGMRPSDLQRAAKLIRMQNPLGRTCGEVCSEKHCVNACTKNVVGAPICIPQLQAAILARADALGAPPVEPRPASGKKAAVIGSGPSGLAAAAVLADAGVDVCIYEKSDCAGGACLQIDAQRLDPAALEKDVAFVKSLGVEIRLGQEEIDIAALEKETDGVIAAVGRDTCVTGGIDGAELALSAKDFLLGSCSCKKTAVIGGGAVAMDCIRKALRDGCGELHVFCLETVCELPLTNEDRDFLFAAKAEIHLRTGLQCIRREGERLSVTAHAVKLKAGADFKPANMEAVPGTDRTESGFDCIVLAMGNRPSFRSEVGGRLLYCGEYAEGPSTVVDAVASGKRAGHELLAALGLEAQTQDGARAPLTSLKKYPVSMACSILGYPVLNPFILSASPMSDGYEHVKAAYEAGWGGAILKTAFHDIPIKTPAEYMYCADALSYANCDSVSARTLEQLCGDVARLRKEFPDRLTMASTGTEMTPDDEENRRRWQYNTKMLEQAGAMGIEYSLSCPGTDGVDALALNQDIAQVTKVARWILECGDPNVIKLFKLTASVPSISPFIRAVREVAEAFPGAKVAVTIGDTLPNLVFQDRGKKTWEDGVIMGMGGKRIFTTNIFSVAKATGQGVPISASGGVTSYNDAADYLAVGAEFVQFCSMPMRYGYQQALHELYSGIGHLMESRNIRSMDELRGAALPDVITAFDRLSEKKRIPAVDTSLCASCGNCQCCPAQAVSLDQERHPVFDPSRCIGCSFCTQICFIGALHMRERTEEEQAVTSA